MLELLNVAVVVVVGVLVGVEFAVAVFLNPVVDRLPDGGGIAARSDAARVLGRVMPFWYAGSIVLSVVWIANEWGSPRMLALVVAATFLVASVLMSVLLLVPINTRVAAWSPAEAPADWKNQVRRWDRLHYVRVGLIGIAFVLLAVAAAAN